LIRFAPPACGATFRCEYCRDTIRQNGVEHIANDLVRLLSKEWLGSTSNSNAPAGIVKKLGYDLFVSKGANATVWETIRTTLQQEGMKEFVKFVGAISLAATILWLGLKRP
jgi:hypothetical protein